jgi:hypothetical protein
MNKPRCWLFVLIVSASGAYAQDADSVSNQVNSVLSPEQDTALTAADSLSIFTLIDSLLNLEALVSSQFAVRLSYNSNVLSAGRTLGIENFGLAPGISYYHKSGFYADLTGYWSRDFDPSYYLTVFSLGYMKDFSKRFSLMAGYDRYFYNLGEGNYIPYRNTLSVTPILEFKPVSLTANYSYYFGDQTAHRIMPGISVTLEKRKLGVIDRIAIHPSFFTLLGNEIIFKEELIPYRTRYGIRYSTVETQVNVFGIMNYAISVPLSISYNNWSFSFTYTYSIPRALPGETLIYSENTYLSSSLTYFIETGRRKNKL